MHICKIITYTPFMAGVKAYEKFYQSITDVDGVKKIGYGHIVPEEELNNYPHGVSLLDAHDIIIVDYDHIGHEVIKKLPKTETCPHWLRAWTDMCYWKGMDILDSDIAKAFLDQDYEKVPYMISEMIGNGHLRSKWDATIHLYGTYEIFKDGKA